MLKGFSDEMMSPKEEQLNIKQTSAENRDAGDSYAKGLQFAVMITRLCNNSNRPSCAHAVLAIDKVPKLVFSGDFVQLRTYTRLSTTVVNATATQQTREQKLKAAHSPSVNVSA